MQLVSLLFDVILTEKVSSDLEVETEGKAELFLERRLIEQTIGLLVALSRLGLGTYMLVLKKSVNSKSYGQVIQFSAQSDIFRKIALIQQISRYYSKHFELVLPCLYMEHWVSKKTLHTLGGGWSRAHNNLSSFAFRRPQETLIVMSITDLSPQLIIVLMLIECSGCIYI